MKTTRSTQEREGKDAVAKALDRAISLWERGDGWAAVRFLARAGRAAARAGNEQRARQLTTLCQDFERAMSVRRASSEAEALVEQEPDTLPSHYLGGGSSQPARPRTPPYSTQQRDACPPSTSKGSMHAKLETLRAEADIDADGPCSGPIPYPRPTLVDSLMSELASHLDCRAASREKRKGRPRTSRRPKHRVRRARKRIRGGLRGRPRGGLDHQEPVSAPPCTAVLDPAVRVPARVAFAKLPVSARALLRGTGQRMVLPRGGIAPEFGLALISSGSLCAHDAVSDRCAVALQGGGLVGGWLKDELSSQACWSACDCPATVTLWDEAITARVLALAPDLVASLANALLRVSALVCVTRGDWCQQLDPAMRSSLFERSSLRVLEPGQVLVERGETVSSLMIMGAGEVSVVRQGARRSLRPGEPVFSSVMLARGRAPSTLRAGGAGATLLNVDAADVHELLCSMPSLLALLSE